MGSFMNRWSGIQLDVNKFCGIYVEVERKRASGTTEQDRMLEAKQKFRKLIKRNFAYEHCWNLLKFHPKWNLELSRKKPKTIPATPSLDTPSASSDTIDLADGDGQGNKAQGLVRPIGKKGCEDLGKKCKS
ncbi:PREDICTED: glutathione S-transferase T2-like [Fragaria vesca subsp. vesca]|uniref:glutathione S-transferase T2-like n=1 Tax=Fragaria vesca subsp. vesca TaxID=101020 RepID=UPI0002C36FDB|nr:PREDICTED: glutathione S-transferase T2-like [Fragaria vesca subsp. vesca]